MEHKEWMRPEDIERRSMEIIEQEMPAGNWTLGERAVVKRCIHTSADFDYASNLYRFFGQIEEPCYFGFLQMEYVLHFHD